MARRLTIDLDDLRIAFEDPSGEHTWYLDVQTGAVSFVTADIEDDATGRYLPVARDDSRAAYRDMQDFIATVDDHRLRALLDRAIAERGAVRMFEDTLRDTPSERDRWFAFQAERVTGRLRRWLESEGIEPV
jgi:hypothetical protein